MNSKKLLVFSIPVIVAILGISLLSSSFQTNDIAPQVTDKAKVSSWLTLKVYDKDGVLKQTVQNHNLIVDVGNDEMAQRIFGAGGVGTTTFQYIGIGTSSTAPAISQTALISPICSRVQDASPDANSAVAGETSVSVISSFSGATCAGSIQEAGLFNTSTSGQMLGRSTFGVITLGASDTLNVNYTVTIT